MKSDHDVDLSSRVCNRDGLEMKRVIKSTVGIKILYTLIPTLITKIKKKEYMLKFLNFR